jgi:hypothetical protein
MNESKAQSFPLSSKIGNQASIDLLKVGKKRVGFNQLQYIMNYDGISKSQNYHIKEKLKIFQHG